MSVPELTKPDVKLPALPSPEIAPTIELDAWLNQPDMIEPVFPKPEPPPIPELKKPDDGRVVEFPKPGTAGTLMIGMSMGPTLVSRSKSSGIGSVLIPEIATAGMSTDKLIGRTSDIDIPWISVAAISIGGMLMGMELLNDIASSAIGSVIRSIGMVIGGSETMSPRGKGKILPDWKPTIGKVNVTLVISGMKSGPTTTGPVAIVPRLSAESRVAAGAVKPTLATPSMPI
ncbi:hypothetical protein MYBA111488_24655 [Mycobacterium basiliense]